ncbi:MAG: hypothetical protein R3C56_37895 [Pirellulaceae bacterium]
MDSHKVQAPQTLAGLKSLVNNEYSLSHQTNEMRSRVSELGKKRATERLKQLRKKNEKLTTTVALKKILTSYADFDAVDETLRRETESQAHPSSK